MKVYIAAPYEMRTEAQLVMAELEKRGIVVTSRWLRDTDNEDNETAEKDLQDIDDADTLLALNPEEYRRSGTGGRHVEFGYALKAGKRLIIVGARTHLFHRLDKVQFFERIGDVTW